jgi:hypothetical protein
MLGYFTLIKKKKCERVPENLNSLCIKKAPTFVEAFPTLNSNSIQWSHLIWSLQKLAI